MFYAKDDRNEMTIDKDIMVLANPEIANLPAWVIALVAAGGLAAALSTAAGLLLVISSAISHDLMKGRDAEHYREAGTAVRAPRGGRRGRDRGPARHLPAGFVAQVVAFAFGLAAASFFPAILLGIFDKKREHAGRHVRHDRGHRVHRRLHHLLQVRRPDGPPAGGS